MVNISRLKSFSYLASFAVLVFLCSPTIRAAERMASGEWEFAMTTDGSTRTIKQCITPDKASEVNGDSKSGRDSVEKSAKGRCAVKSYEIAGDTVSYSLTCGGTQIESVTTFHGDSSEGSKVTTTAAESIKTQIKARRLGACP